MIFQFCFYTHVLVQNSKIRFYLILHVPEPNHMLMWLTEPKCFQKLRKILEVIHHVSTQNLALEKLPPPLKHDTVVAKNNDYSPYCCIFQPYWEIIILIWPNLSSPWAMKQCCFSLWCLCWWWCWLSNWWHCYL